MPEDIFRELEELKRVLETPEAPSRPSEGSAVPPTIVPGAPGDSGDGTGEYAAVVSGAEVRPSRRPRRPYNKLPTKSLGLHTVRGATQAAPRSTRRQAHLNTQEGVERLTRAISQADDEVETALRRTEAVQRLAAHRREQEIEELRHVIASKEQGIDALRGELSGTKRAAEERARSLSEALEAQNQQVRR